MDGNVFKQQPKGLDDVVAAIAIRQDRLARFEKSLKKRKQQLEEDKRALCDLLLSHGLDSASCNNHLHPVVVTKERFYIPSRKKQQAYTWLKDQGLGSLVKETVSWQSLQASLKEQLENGEEIPEELFNHQTERTVTLRGLGKFLSERRQNG